MFYPRTLLSPAFSITMMMFTDRSPLNTYILTHSLKLHIHITMLYPTILLALTAIQVAAQDANPTSEGDVQFTAPTAIAEGITLVPVDIGDPNGSGSYDSEPSSAATSEAATEYSTSSSSSSESTSSTGSAVETSQTASSSTLASTESSPSAPPTNPPVYFHIKYAADSSKCLGVFDTSHQNNTPVV